MPPKSVVAFQNLALLAATAGLLLFAYFFATGRTVRSEMPLYVGSILAFIGMGITGRMTARRRSAAAKWLYIVLTIVMTVITALILRRTLGQTSLDPRVVLSLLVIATSAASLVCLVLRPTTAWLRQEPRA